MVRFTVRIEPRVPPEFVTRWWTDYSSEDPKLGGDVERRDVERLDDRRQRIVTQLRFGKRPVKIDGVVTLTPPSSWHMDGQMQVGGRPFARELIDFQVEAIPQGARLTAEFQFQGKGPLQKLLLGILGGRIRKGREQAYRDYSRAMEDDHRRDGPPPQAAPTS